MSLTLTSYGEEVEEEFRCKVLDHEDGKLYIDYPVSSLTGRTAFLMDGMKLSVQFVDPASASALYLFQTEVIGRVKRNIPMIMLHDPGAKEYIRIQRRKFVRVEAAVDAAIADENSPLFSSVTENISAGGAAIVLPPSFQDPGEQAVFSLYIVLPREQDEPLYVETAAQLIRIVTNEHSGRRVGSFQFLDIDHAVQQLILRYCFDRQLELRRKGL